MRRSREAGLILAALMVLVAGAPVWAQAPTPEEFFETRIRPILTTNCYSCHGELGMAGLRVDSREGLLKGGKSGAAIVPGDPEVSLLIKAVSHSLENLK